MLIRWRKYQLQFEILFVLVLAASVRLTSLNVFRAVDEEDRWRWAIDFYRALLAGDLAATLVGDGYPGILPVWLETLWLLLASLYRSILQGGWIGDEGVYLLIHEWSRTSHLWLQRFPVVVANTLLVVIIFLYLRYLFGQRVALLSAILISLDPFYLSDSRVNRAEGLLTGLMMVSLLALIAAHRHKNWRHFVVSGLFGGLAWLTKSQALVLLPLFGVISLIWQRRAAGEWPLAFRRWLMLMASWSGMALLTFILLWPAAWTVPGPTFQLMYNYLTHKVGEEGVKIFFLGQTMLDEDPGLIFYPVIFILRTTPLMLLGLLLGLWLLIRRRWGEAEPANQISDGGKADAGSEQPSVPNEISGRRINFALQPKLQLKLDEAGVWALLAYALLYAGGMSLGSHKQDRFLMAAFPALNILAALAFVTLAQRRGWTVRQFLAGGVLLLGLQLATALPYHPYYFSYFNPLAGGGPVAVKLTRVGWGEGMDQVADYLQSLKGAESLVVASRFYHYLLGFEGQRINLGEDGDWVRADKVVFYIQQTQRMLEPSPGLIRYFEQHVQPEKVISIDGIDYAKVYPNPIQYPANPLVDRLEEELSLFGYRWESPESGATIRLIWENLSARERAVAVRLWANQNEHSDWLPCITLPNFEAAARTPGEVVESSCPLSAAGLAAGLYDLQVGIQQADTSWLPLAFTSGWAAIELSDGAALQRVSPEVAFARLANEAVPDSAIRLEHTYADRVRLLAYELTPALVQPGRAISITLYWQANRVLEQDAHMSIQAFLNNNERVALVNGPPLDNLRPTSSWHPGEVIRDVWLIDLPPDMQAPALLRLDVSLFLPDTLLTLPVRNLAGEDIPGQIAEVRVEPDRWPTYQGNHPVEVVFGEAIGLIGYETGPGPEPNTLDVTLYWAALAPMPEGEALTTFLHLLSPAGELAAQSDVPPAGGLFPTSAWQPGDVVLSQHRLKLPEDASSESYTLLAGLYHPANGARLPARNSDDEPLSDNAAPLGSIILP